MIFVANIYLKLDKFSLSFNESISGGINGIFGPSGSGKSTLLNCFMGLNKKVKGSIQMNEKQWLNTQNGSFFPVHKRNIGFVPQSSPLFPHKDVEGNLFMGFNRRGGIKKDHEFIKQVIDILQLNELLHRRITDLSGGEKQRISLGRAICSQPDLLILDEPMASLDGKLKHHISNLLLQINKNLQIPMIIVSHNARELLALCDDVILLEKGNVIHRGIPFEIFNNPSAMRPYSPIHFNNLLKGIVTAKTPYSTTFNISLSNKSVELIGPPTDLKIGDTAILKIPARDILITLFENTQTSARNFIPAHIKLINNTDSVVQMTTIITRDNSQLTVELSHDSSQYFQLETGMLVYLIIKSNTIRI